MDENRFIVRSLTPPQAARNALAIAVQRQRLLRGIQGVKKVSGLNAKDRGSSGWLAGQCIGKGFNKDILVPGQFNGYINDRQRHGPFSIVFDFYNIL